MKTRKLITENTENTVVDAIVKLAEEHQLSFSNLNRIFARVSEHMLDNATLEKEPSTINPCQTPIDQ